MPSPGATEGKGQAWGQCGGGHTHPRGHTRSRVRPGVSVRVVGHAQPRGHKQSWVRPGVSVWGGGGHTQGVGSPGQPWDSSCGYCEYSGQSERLCPGRRSLGVAGLGLGSPGTRGAAAPGHTPQERALLIVSTAPPQERPESALRLRAAACLSPCHASVAPSGLAPLHWVCLGVFAIVLTVIVLHLTSSFSNCLGSKVCLVFSQAFSAQPLEWILPVLADELCV